jgi:hypothetical protein
MAQVEEHLHSKCEVLSSNPSTAIKKKERKKDGYGGGMHSI